MARSAVVQAAPIRNLQQEMVAAAALKEQVIAILGEENTDAQTLLDAFEGETQLLEMIDAVVLQIGEDESRVEGIKGFQQKLAARSKRLDDRVDALRAMLTNALDLLGEKKLERPLATVTLKNTAAKLNVVEEALIPSAYWKTPAPVLDRKAVGDALKARRDEIEKLAAMVEDGSVSPEYASAERAKLEAAHPVVPGAELDNGGVTIQIRFK